MAGEQFKSNTVVIRGGKLNSREGASLLTQQRGQRLKGDAAETEKGHLGETIGILEKKESEVKMLRLVYYSRKWMERALLPIYHITPT